MAELNLQIGLSPEAKSEIDRLVEAAGVITAAQGTISVHAEQIDDLASGTNRLADHVQQNSRHIDGLSGAIQQEAQHRLALAQRVAVLEGTGPVDPGDDGDDGTPPDVDPPDDPDDDDPDIDPPDDEFEAAFDITMRNATGYTIIHIPKNRSSAQAIEESLQNAERARRQGKPVAVLFERGGRYPIAANRQKNWGTILRGTAAQPSILGAFGDGDRPILVGVNKGALMNAVGNDSGNWSDCIIDSLAMRPRDGERFKYPGIRIVCAASNVAIERCDVQWFKDGVVFDNPGAKDGDWAERFRFRGNVLSRNGDGSPIDGSGPEAHAKRSQGMYVGGCRGIEITHNIVSYCGWTSWHPDVRAALPAHLRGDERANASIYSHGIYIQYSCDDRPDLGLPIVVQHNWFYRNGSHGVQVRPGGIVSHNVFWRNGIGVFVGSPEAINKTGDKLSAAQITDNIVVESEPISNALGRNWGLEVNAVNRHSVIERNIIANPSPDGHRYGLVISARNGGGTGGVNVAKNIMQGTRSLIHVSKVGEGEPINVGGNLWDDRNTTGLLNGTVRGVSGNAQMQRDVTTEQIGIGFGDNRTFVWNPPRMAELYGDDLAARMLHGDGVPLIADVLNRYYESAMAAAGGQ